MNPIALAAVVSIFLASSARAQEDICKQLPKETPVPAAAPAPATVPAPAPAAEPEICKYRPAVAAVPAAPAPAAVEPKDEECGPGLAGVCKRAMRALRLMAERTRKEADEQAPVVVPAVAPAPAAPANIDGKGVREPRLAPPAPAAPAPYEHEEGKGRLQPPAAPTPAPAARNEPPAYENPEGKYFERR